MAEFTVESDPADFTVDEVAAYLATASDDEVARVRALEGQGKNRKGITEASKPRAPKDGSDGYTRVVVDAYPLPQE